MTLQERLREAGVELSARGWRDSCGSPDCGIASNLANEAAAALVAKDARIKELEEVLREVDGLINYQYSGTRDAMSYLQHIANRVLEALK